MIESLEHTIRTAINRNFPDVTGLTILDADDHGESDSTSNWLVRVRFTSSDLARIEQLLVSVVSPDDGANEEALNEVLDTKGVPVARVLLAQPDAIGTRLVREYVPGTSLVHLLNDASMRWELSALAFTFARTLARIHNIDWRTAVPWMGDAEALEDELVAAQLDFWLEEWQGRVESSPEQYQGDLQAGLNWIDAFRPTEVSVCLCHGDYRPANIIMDGDEVSAIVGWQHALVSDAAFDLCLLPFEIRQLGLPDEDADLLCQAIFGSYLQSSQRSLGNVQFYAVTRLLDAALMALDPDVRSPNKIAAFSTDADILFDALRQAMSSDKRALWKL